MARVYTPKLEEMITSSVNGRKIARTPGFKRPVDLPKEMISIKSPFLEEGEEIVVPKGMEEEMFISREEDIKRYKEEDFPIGSERQITKSLQYPQGYVPEFEERELLEETSEPTIGVYWWSNNQQYVIDYDPFLSIDEIKMEMEDITGIPMSKQSLLDEEGKEIMYGTLEDNLITIGDRLLLL